MLQARNITEPSLYADTGIVPLKGVSISGRGALCSCKHYRGAAI